MSEVALRISGLRPIEVAELEEAVGVHAEEVPVERDDHLYREPGTMTVLLVLGVAGITALTTHLLKTGTKHKQKLRLTVRTKDGDYVELTHSSETSESHLDAEVAGIIAKSGADLAALARAAAGAGGG